MQELGIDLIEMHTGIQGEVQHECVQCPFRSTHMFGLQLQAAGSCLEKSD